MVGPARFSAIRGGFAPWRMRALRGAENGLNRGNPGFFRVFLSFSGLQF
jgi:hypothetical protein